ncbi:MAG: glycosyltransferase family 9 protein, partial [Candidatus Binatia bacterium]
MSGPGPPASRILVKEVNWLGDLVMSLPALRAVRRAYPDAELSVLVKRELASFFDGMESVNRVIPYRIRPALAGIADRWRVVQTVRAGGFDLAVLFPSSFESALWIAAAGVPARAGVVRDARAPLLTHRAKPPRAGTGRHQSHDYLAMLAETLDIRGSADDVRIEAAEANRARMHGWLRERRRRPERPLIAVAPAAAYGPAKEWPPDRYVSLIDRLAEEHG